MSLRGAKRRGNPLKIAPFLTTSHKRYSIVCSAESRGEGKGFTLAEVFSPCRKAILNFGFTLAEVLITLGIIGIVAALVLPGWVESYEKRRVAASLKKSYAELNQVLDMAIAEHGDPSSWNYYEAENLDKWVETYIVPYVSVSSFGSCKGLNIFAKSCYGVYPTFMLGSNRLNSYPYYMLAKNNGAVAWGFKRDTGTYEPFTYALVYLKKGKPVKTSNTPYSKQYLMFGKDVFVFMFDSKDKTLRFKPYGIDRFVPYARGYQPTRTQLLGTAAWGGCNANASGAGYVGPGYACAAVIMLDGWEIKGDYPW